MLTRVSFRTWLAAVLLVVAAVASPAAAQLQVATVRGVVEDPQHRPVAAVTVRIDDPSGVAVATTATDAAGRFDVTGLAPGTYVIRVVQVDRVLVTTRLVIRGALPVDLALTTGSAVAEEVVVRGDASRNAAEQPRLIAGETIRNDTAALPSQRVQSALAALPGWTSEDNGLLHIRGVDDGLLYVQDGLPVYARLDRLFGTPPSTAGIASVSVLNGYIPPEFGLKAGGVVQVRSRSGLTGAWRHSLDAGLADLATGHVNGVSSGPVTAGLGLMVTGSSERSARFLDPVDPENRHNTGRSSFLGSQMSVQRGVSLFTGSLNGSRSRYDVPHGEAQDEAGQDQRQETRQWVGSASWQGVRSERTVWHLSLYRRSGQASLVASPGDLPLTSSGTRGDVRVGALWSLSHQRGRHLVKLGVEGSTSRVREQFTFAVTGEEAAEDAELSDAALAFTEARPFVFAGTARPRVWSVFAQDSFQVSSRLTVDYGVRFDHSRQLVSASQLSPRAGVAWRATPRTTLRASAMRLFQPPQVEYLLLASAPEARALSPFVTDAGVGGADLPPERQTALELSVTRDLGSAWDVEATVWRRRGRDVNDPNVFFGTTVTFPNSVARQQASGLDLRVDMQPRRGFTFGATYTHARILQFGPINGGVFLEENYLDVRDGTPFVPDHEMRHALAVRTSYGPSSGAWRLAGTVRYRTAPPLQVEEDDLDALRERAGAETVDFEARRVRPQFVTDLQAHWTLARRGPASATLIAWVDNLLDRAYAYNFGNPFSGTHFGAPRRIGLTLRLAR